MVKLVNIDEFLRVTKWKGYSAKQRHSLGEILDRADIADRSAIIDATEAYVRRNRISISASRAFAWKGAQRRADRIHRLASRLDRELSNMELALFFALFTTAGPSEATPAEEANLGVQAHAVPAVDKMARLGRAFTGVTDLAEWSGQLSEALGSDGRPKQLPGLVTAIAHIADIWREHGASPGRVVDWDSHKPQGVFLEFIEAALMPLIPKTQRGWSLDNAIRTALSHGEKESKLAT